MKEIYFVESGDSIESIAEKFKVRAADIMEYNRISASNIVPGVALMIVRHDGERYIVKPFDTVAKIAEKHGVSPDSIRKHNGIKEVFLGQIIFLPKAQPTVNI